MSADDNIPTSEIQKKSPAGNAGQAGNSESTSYSIINYDNEFKYFSPSFEYLVRGIHHPFINCTFGGE
jgi:hypothetical protein